jgi:hypothetical protein
MFRFLPIAAAFAIVISSGVVHGLWTDRWSLSHQLQTAVDRLETIPLEFGDWKGRPEELDRRQQEAAGIAGYISRRYENRREGTAVSVLLACGRPGPISNHRPEICYTASGFDALGDRVQEPVTFGRDQPPADFSLVTFRKQNTAIPSFLRILYAWNARGPWQAPQGDPRLTFASAPALYKLYVVRETVTPNVAAGDEPCLSFLRDFLPVVDPILFPRQPSGA